jgi:hypothetical protein
MTDPGSSVRQRKSKENPKEPADGSTASEPAEAQAFQPKARSAKAKIEEEDSWSPFVDAFRVLAFLLLASAGLSYLVSGGETWTWGLKTRPKFADLDWWKAQFVCTVTPPPPTPPLHLNLCLGRTDVQPLCRPTNANCHSSAVRSRSRPPSLPLTTAATRPSRST